ncbi:MAG: transcriptional regulator [Flavobacteriales bacterium]|nr:MAG: transcriptional regulator [Flavobacteriales bacterium]
METLEKNICQSCGMPMLQLTDFGWNGDGSINTEYCQYCYKNGAFTDGDITLEEKISKNIAMAQKMGMSRASATNLAVTTLPNLKRWGKKKEQRKSGSRIKK